MDQETKGYIGETITRAMEGVKAVINPEQQYDINLSTYCVQSPEINELNKAISKAQGEMDGAFKDKSNPFYKSKYADLEAIWGVARKPLSSNGLSVRQWIDHDGIRLVTRLAHSSGQWEIGYWPLTVIKKDPQGVMSSVTYARRGALASILGIFQTDDDGNEASDDCKLERETKSTGKSVTMPKKTTKIEAMGLDTKPASKDIVEIAKEVFPNSEEIPMISTGQAEALELRLEKLADLSKQKFRREFKTLQVSNIEKKKFTAVCKLVSKLEKESKVA